MYRVKTVVIKERENHFQEYIDASLLEPASFFLSFHSLLLKALFKLQIRQNKCPSSSGMTTVAILDEDVWFYSHFTTSTRVSQSFDICFQSDDGRN